MILRFTCISYDMIVVGMPIIDGTCTINVTCYQGDPTKCTWNILNLKITTTYNGIYLGVMIFIVIVNYPCCGIEVMVLKFQFYW